VALILSIETATKVCSVALSKNGQTIAFKEEDGAYSHAEKLALFIDELIQESSYEYSDIDAVAVSKGPGSYTGLRIGVSLAKGLCYSLQKPLLAIETLKAMAWGASQEIGLGDYSLCPMIDARRMEVYSAIYSQELECLKTTSADVINEDSYASFIEEKPVYFFGDGAEKCREVIKHKNAVFSKSFFPSARSLGVLAQELYEQKVWEDVAYFEPYYLKEFIALKGKKLV
jgi:tRNA threonylcarbamoyladenosine biosynthesis protein TsaB